MQLIFLLFAIFIGHCKYNGFYLDIEEESKAFQISCALPLVANSYREKEWQFFNFAVDQTSFESPSFQRPCIIEASRFLDQQSSNVDSKECRLVMPVVSCHEWKTCEPLPSLWWSLGCSRKCSRDFLRSMGRLGTKGLFKLQPERTVAQISQEIWEEQRERQREESQTPQECRQEAGHATSECFRASAGHGTAIHHAHECWHHLDASSASDYTGSSAACCYPSSNNRRSGPATRIQTSDRILEEKPEQGYLTGGCTAGDEDFESQRGERADQRDVPGGQEPQQS